MLQRFKELTSLFLGILLVSAGAAGAGVIDIPGLERSAGSPVYPLSFQSNDPQLQALCQRAFLVHGAYRVVPREQAAFTLRVDRVASDQVSMEIVSGSQRLARETVRGRDWRHATLLACDRAVEMTSGLPGFFAGKLAFVGERTGSKEIYIGDLFFQRYQAVTQDGSESVSPRWSPDGTRILYTGYYRSGFPEIYVLDLADKSRRVIARYRGTNTGGTYSPNGSRIAMILSSPGNPELYIADAEGRRPRRMTDNRSLEASPCFSPDGSRIVLTSDPMGVPQIYVIGIDQRSRQNQGMRRIARNVSGNCSEPVWNPANSDQIAFTLLQGGNFQIGLYRFSTDEVEVLTQTGGDSVEPSWTNDGRHLLYTLRASGRKQLRILDTVTRKSVALHSLQVGDTSQPCFVYAP